MNSVTIRDCILWLMEIIEDYRRQDYYNGSNKELMFLEVLTPLLEEAVISGYLPEKELVFRLNSLLMARENKDYVLLADLYQCSLLPILLSLQDACKKKDSGEFWKNNIESLSDSLLKKQLLLENALEGIRCEVEETVTGEKTLRLEGEERSWYLHSSYSPQAEARVVAETWFSPGQERYKIIGFGLGYHIEELVKRSHRISCMVLEPSLAVLQAAFRYRDLSPLLKSGQVKLCYDPKLFYLQDYKDGEDWLIYGPSLGSISEQRRREWVEEYFLQVNTAKVQGMALIDNFMENRDKFSFFIDSLEEKLKGQELILVAGGPSLDENLEKLRTLRQGRILLAVGTVFHKLCREGIVPDYVIITDGKKSMKGQIEGMEEFGMPLWHLSTVSPKLLKAYKGKKYCILQKDFSLSEDYAKEHGLKTYETGGSVTTTAISVAIAFGVRRVLCFGLDLAYTDGRSHASDTKGLREAARGQRKVCAVGGNMVETSVNLDSYRHWIERKIGEVKKTEFINISRGAKISGMKNQTTFGTGKGLDKNGKAD
ncbi:MAG: motility associated factor glycosyltransferase family protein [Acetivibrio ethanolgignens]